MTWARSIWAAATVNRRLLAACLALLSAPLAAEVLDQSAQGFTLSNTATANVGPDRAWQALIAEVDQWWPKDHSWFGAAGRFSIEASAGGCFCEIAGARQAQHMQVLFVDPPRLLRLGGGLGPLQGMGLAGVMEFRISPAADESGGSQLTLWYRAGGYTPQPLGDFVGVVDQVQALQLGALASHLNGTDAP